MSLKVSLARVFFSPHAFQYISPSRQQKVNRDSDMGVSKNKGTPKWMVYNGKPYQNGWFGGTTIFWKHPHELFCKVFSFFSGSSASRDFRAVTVFPNSWWHGFLFSQIWIKVDQIYTSIGRGSIDCLIEVFTRPQNVGRWHVIQKSSWSFQYIPSRELTYPPKMGFWRWFSFSQGGIC